jgi:hypothetical protein
MGQARLGLDGGSLSGQFGKPIGVALGRRASGFF